MAFCERPNFCTCCTSTEFLIFPNQSQIVPLAASPLCSTPSSTRHRCHSAPTASLAAWRCPTIWRSWSRATRPRPRLQRGCFDSCLSSHLIDPALARGDSFDTFMADRQKRLLCLIERGTGKAAFAGDGAKKGEDAQADEDTTEADMTIAT